MDTFEVIGITPFAYISNGIELVGYYICFLEVEISMCYVLTLTKSHMSNKEYKTYWELRNANVNDIYSITYIPKEESYISLLHSQLEVIHDLFVIKTNDYWINWNNWKLINE